MLHLVEFWVDGLVGLLEHINEILGLLGVGGSEEGISSAGVLSASRAANSMNIVLSVGRKVKIDDIFNVSDIFSVNGFSSARGNRDRQCSHDGIVMYYTQ